jgi:hypothetical protein
MIIAIKNGEVVSQRGEKRSFLKGVRMPDGGYLATVFEEKDRCFLIHKVEKLKTEDIKLPKLRKKETWLERYEIEGLPKYEIYEYLGNYNFHVCASFSFERYIIEYKGKVYDINNETFFALNLPCPDEKIEVKKVDMRLVKRFDPDNYSELNIITDNDITINENKEIENYEEVVQKYGKIENFIYRDTKGWYSYLCRVYSTFKRE